MDGSKQSNADIPVIPESEGFKRIMARYRAHQSESGRKGGSSRSERKITASRASLVKARARRHNKVVIIPPEPERAPTRDEVIPVPETPSPLYNDDLLKGATRK